LDWLVEGAGLGHLQGSNTRALAGPIAFHLGAEPRMLQQGGRTMHVARFTPAGFSCSTAFSPLYWLQSLLLGESDVAKWYSEVV